MARTRKNSLLAGARTSRKVIATAAGWPPAGEQLKRGITLKCAKK